MSQLVIGQKKIYVASTSCMTWLNPTLKMTYEYICNTKTPNIVYFPIYLWIYSKNVIHSGRDLKQVVVAAVLLIFKVFFFFNDTSGPKIIHR